MIYSSEINSIGLGEFDLGGVLYHARYFHIYEELREGFLSQAGVPYPKLVEQKSHLVVLETSQKFFKPIGYGQQCRAELKVLDLKKSSFVFKYKIFYTQIPNSKASSKSESGSETIKAPIHEAWTKHAFVQINQNSASQNNNFKVSAIPKELHEKLRQYS